MDRQPHSSSREAIVADAIRETVSELRLVDVADYIAFLRLEHMSTIADIVSSAAELYLMPGTLRLGHGGDAHVSWEDVPRIVLDLELKPKGATVYFQLSMSAEKAGIEVHYVAFEQPDEDPSANTAFLASALDAARIRRTERVEL